MLLPSHATPLERALDVVVRELLDVDVAPIRELRCPETCLPTWLPWLAWERHVDAWDDDWPIETKRQAVAESFERHQRAGTLAGDKRILREAGAVFELDENPAGDHHTVAIRILNSQGLTLDIAEIERSLKATGRLSVHYTVTAVAGLDGDVSIGHSLTARGLVSYSAATAGGHVDTDGVVLRLTTAGAALLADDGNAGADAVNLLRVQVGSGSGPGGPADDGRTALRQPQDAADLVGSRDGGQISVVGRVEPATSYDVTELGLWARVGAAGADTLLAYWTGAAVAAAVPNGVIDVRGALDLRSAEADVALTVDPDAGSRGPAGESS